MALNNLDIIPFTSKHYAEIEKIIISIWGERVSYYRFGEERHEDGILALATYLAIIERNVVGFYSVWKNRVHPHSLYFTVHVQPEYQRKGIGSRLLQHMKKLNTKGLPLQTALWETGISGRNFLLKEGFLELRRTYETKLNVDAFESKGFTEKKSTLYKKGYRLKKSSELTEKEKGEFLKLCKSSYVKTHQGNPPASLELNDWQKIIERDLIAGGSFVVIKDKHLIGFALMHTSNETSLDLGWRGIDLSNSEDYLTTEIDSKLERELLIILTQEQINFAALKGIKQLNAEIDTTDKWAMIVMDYFPFRPVPTWITYRKEIDSLPKMEGTR